MMKKILMTLASILVLAAAGLGGFAWHIYKKDFGVPYKGRARLDYNWKYYFAERPEKDGTFKRHYFSYSYPKFKGSGDIIALTNGEDEFLVDGYRMLYVWWNKNNPDFVKAELRKQLGDKDIGRPSNEFMRWLNPESYRFRKIEKSIDYSKLYEIKAEKVSLKRGGEALLFSLWSKVPERYSEKLLIGLAPGGQVFKVETVVHPNISEETYRDLMFSPHVGARIYPNPERDAKSVYSLNKFIESVEFYR